MLFAIGQEDDNLPDLRKEYIITPLNGSRCLPLPPPPFQGQIWAIARQKLCIMCKQQWA